MSGTQCNSTAIEPVFPRGDQEEFYHRIVCRGGRGQPWLALLFGKSVERIKQNENDRNADEDDDESDEAPE